MSTTVDWGLRARMLGTVALYAGFAALFVGAVYWLWFGLVPRMISWWAVTFEANADIAMVAFVILGGAIAYFGYNFAKNVYVSPQSELDAIPASPDAYPRIHQITERTALEMDIPVPEIAVVGSEAPNAYVHGFTQRGSTLVVTKGLLDTLDDDELSAVVAHELAHIANRDAAVMSVGYLLPAVTFGLAKAITAPFERDNEKTGTRRNAPPNRRASRSAGRRAGSAGGRLWIIPLPSDGSGGDDIRMILVLLVILAITAVLTFAISVLFWLFTSLVVVLLARTREFTADRAAAAVTGDPYALESALDTIYGQMDRLPEADLRKIDGAVETMYFAPLEQGIFDRSDGGFLVSEDIFPDTHPSLDARKERLQTLDHE